MEEPGSLPRPALGIATVYGIVCWLKNLLVPKTQVSGLEEVLSGMNQDELDEEKRIRSDRLREYREEEYIDPDNWLQEWIEKKVGKEKSTMVMQYAHLVGSMFVTSYNPFEFFSFYQEAQNLDIVGSEARKIVDVLKEITVASHGAKEKPNGFLGSTWALIEMTTGMEDPYYQSDKSTSNVVETRKAEGDALGVDEDDVWSRPKWVLAIDRLNPHLGSLLRVARWMTGKGKKDATFTERLKSLFAPYNIRDRMLK